VDVERGKETVLAAAGNGTLVVQSLSTQRSSCILR
jgi:hypothetical protein